jgi:hypothetical protein
MFYCHYLARQTDEPVFILNLLAFEVLHLKLPMSSCSIVSALQPDKTKKLK